LEITADGDLVLKANLSSQTDINLTSHHGKITQSGDIKAAQNIDINANQTYQNEGKDTIAQANLAITDPPWVFSWVLVVSCVSFCVSLINPPWVFPWVLMVSCVSFCVSFRVLFSVTDINLTSHHGNITQSGDIKAVQNIDINANQTYQNEGKDTIAQANLAITANTVNNQGLRLSFYHLTGD
jgi:hypothetical protein